MSKLSQDLVDRYNVLISEGISRRAACSALGLSESTMRYREKKGLSSFIETDMAAKVAVTGEVNKIAVVADTQCKSEESLVYMSHIGSYVASKRPDVIVHIGDHYDFPSLSTYDKGKKSFEGRRLKADLEAGTEGMQLFMDEVNKEEGYSPRLIFCMGNHEDRLRRLCEEMPELDGVFEEPSEVLPTFGWEVYPFLKPAVISGIHFVHFLANPFTGNPYGGNALNQLKNVGVSYVVGHKQCLDMAIRPTLDGRHQIGIINGACYPFDEGYKGCQGNNHFRGLIMLNEVEEGFALPSPVSLKHMENQYGLL